MLAMLNLTANTCFGASFTLSTSARVYHSPAHVTIYSTPGCVEAAGRCRNGGGEGRMSTGLRTRTRTPDLAGCTLQICGVSTHVTRLVRFYIKSLAASKAVFCLTVPLPACRSVS